MAGRTPADHYAQAQRNAAFYREIGGSQSKHPEWAVTALFYTAVHEVEAALLKLNQGSSGDHTRRRKGIRQTLPRAHAKYEQLEQMSQDARYECFRHNPNQIDAAETLLEDIRHEIAKVAPPPY